jgi:hypothetical protein
MWFDRRAEETDNVSLISFLLPIDGDNLFYMIFILSRSPNVFCCLVFCKTVKIISLRIKERLEKIK